MTALVRGKPVEITRQGQFYDPRYGVFEITAEMLRQMVQNFETNAFGQKIFFDISHQPQLGAAGELTRLWIDGESLWGEVAWTPFGAISIEEKGFRYCSAEFEEKFCDNESGEMKGCLLKGVGLTIRPVIKRLEGIQLSEFEHFRAKLEGRSADPAAESALMGLWANAGPLPAPDRAALESSLLALAESFPDRQPRIELAELERIMAARDAAKAAQAHHAAQQFAAKRQAFKKSLTSHPSFWRHLSDAQRGIFAGAIALVQPDSPDDFIVALAEHQTRMIDSIAIAKQLADLGWQGPMPSVRLSELWDDDAR